MPTDFWTTSTQHDIVQWYDGNSHFPTAHGVHEWVPAVPSVFLNLQVRSVQLIWSTTSTCVMVGKKLVNLTRHWTYLTQCQPIVRSWQRKQLLTTRPIPHMSHAQPNHFGSRVAILRGRGEWWGDKKLRSDKEQKLTLKKHSPDNFCATLLTTSSADSASPSSSGSSSIGNWEIGSSDCCKGSTLSGEEYKKGHYSMKSKTYSALQ